MPKGVWKQVEGPSHNAASDHFLFTAESLFVLESWQPRETYRGQTLSLKCIAAASLQALHCGRESIDALRLFDCTHVQSITPHQTRSIRLTALFDEFADLFASGLRELRDIYATIYVKPDFQARLHKARSLPIALKQKIDAELERLVTEGVLEPMTTAPCDTVLIVPVLKTNGSVRVCAAFKVRINRYIDV